MRLAKPVDAEAQPLGDFDAFVVVMVWKIAVRLVVGSTVPAHDVVSKVGMTVLLRTRLATRIAEPNSRSLTLWYLCSWCTSWNTANKPIIAQVSGGKTSTTKARPLQSTFPSSGSAKCAQMTCTANGWLGVRRRPSKDEDN